MRRVLTLLAFLAVGLAACASTVPGSRGGGEDGPFLYVANQDDATVQVIDIGTLETVELIDLRVLGFTANAKPHHVVVEPDGSAWYVSLIGENRVLKFDRSNALVAQAELEVPGMLALHPDDDILYVGRSMSAVNPPRRIGIVDRNEMEVREEVGVFFPRPHAMAVSRDGRWAYTASLAANQMAAVDAAGEEVELHDLEGPVHTLVDFAVSPDGGTLVGTGEISGRLLVFDLSDPANPRRTHTVDVGSRPWHPVFTPDGSAVYFGNKGDDSVTVVETAGWTVAATITGRGLDRPHGAAVSPDGRYVFVSNNGGTVVVIDTSTREIVRVVPAGSNAAGLGTAAGA